MVKKITIVLLLALTLHANYKRDCLSCHEKLQLDLHEIYMQYLLKFSVNEQIAQTMFYFLKAPTVNQAVIDKSIIKKFGLMPKPNLSDEELKADIKTLIRLNDLRGKLY